jgi:hypothetical protein
MGGNFNLSPDILANLAKSIPNMNSMNDTVGSGSKLTGGKRRRQKTKRRGCRKGGFRYSRKSSRTRSRSSRRSSSRRKN